MSQHRGATAVVVGRAGYPDLLEVFAWLDREPVLNAYLAALVLRDGLASAADEFWLARRAGGIAGLVCLGAVSGCVLPVGEDPEALEALAGRAVERLGALPRRFQVVGERAAVAAVADRLRARGLVPRLELPQTYMAVERGRLAPFERLAELRPARPEDYDLVHRTGAELRAEELLEDPRQADPEAYARRVEEECRLGYTHLWLEDGELLFRASLSALTADAVQVSGVFVPPAHRNRGLARRGLAELCERLFARTRAACLFVNDANAPAIAVYRRLGFGDRARWASAFFDQGWCG
jgi:hypothetical protein